MKYVKKKNPISWILFCLLYANNITNMITKPTMLAKLPKKQIVRSIIKNIIVLHYFIP